MADESLEEFKKRTGAVGGSATDGGESLDDFKKRTGAVAAPTTTTQEKPTAQDPYSGAPISDDVPPWMTQDAPTSLEDLRDRMQRGETSILNALKPGPDAGIPEQVLRTVGAVGVHALGGLAQFPVNALIGLKEGPSGGVTWNPETGTYGLTPEAMATTQLLTGGGPAGRDIRFSGPRPLEFVPPGTLEKAPIPPETAANLLSPDARARAAEITYPSADMPTVVVRPPSATAPASGSTTPSGSGGWRPVGPDEIMPPGRSYRMNMNTGEMEVLEPGDTQATAATPAQQPIGAITSSTGIPPPPRPEVAQPAGAQVTPGYEAIHTPAEEAAYRATAEGQKLLEPQIIGERDLNQYIPGETVNNAEREQTVKTARELKELGIRVPEASNLDKAAAESNNTARTIYTENTAKGPVEIANRNTQRQTDIEADKKTVFAPGNVTGPVNLQPVISHMEDVLNQPFSRENTALQQAYRPWLDRLKGFADGKIDSPEQAWGLRYDMDQQTDKFATRDNPNMHRIAGKLNDAAGVLDGEIEKAAPGYADMLAKYKEHSRAIDEMTVLQGALKNLRGPGQTMTYNDFQRFMKNVVDSRMTPSTDLNAFKAISPENMQRLWNIRDSLRRTASAKELARAAGSDTMPNIIDTLKAVGKMGGTAALHAYAGAHLGPGGNMALMALGQIGRTLNDRRMIRRATQQMQNLLRPSQPLRVPPGQENPLTGAPPPP